MADQKRKKQRQAGPSQRAVAAKEAEAKAAQAAADVERQKTELRRLELEAQDRVAKRAEDRRAADKAPSEQLRQVGMVAVPLAAGMMFGKMKADKMQAAAAVMAKAKNKELAKVAAKVRGSRDLSRLTAAVKVADSLKLTQMKGPVGAITAGFFVSEAVLARVVGASSENETAREVLNATALGLGAAAVGTVGTRAVQRATSSILPNAAAMVEIETAREQISKHAQKAPRARRALSAAGRLALPIVAGAAAVTAFNSAASASEARGEDSAAARSQGATEATKALTDVLSFGAGEATAKARAAGRSMGQAVSEGLFTGAVNIATFGVAKAADDALRDQGGFSGFLVDTVKAAAGRIGEAGKVFLNAAAERKAQAVHRAPMPGPMSSAQQQRSDGQTASYTRRGRNGQAVQVAAYRTPTR